MNSKVVVFYFLILLSFSATAQLSDLHYLPPLKQGRNNQGIREQAIYLSTPETTAFTVNVYRGTNTTPIWTYSISNTNAAVINAGAGLTNGDNNITLVNNNNTGVVLNNSGLRFESPSGNGFYVNYRGRSTNQAASLTSKGRESLGTNFRWGGVPNLGGHNSKSNTLGIMATEDNTTVTLSGYDPNCTFRLQGNEDGITADIYTVTLDANESFVFENYVGNRNIPAHIDGWIGATITSDKDIAVSNGSLNYGRVAGNSNRDAGMDQTVPINNLGKDYVFIRGNGNANGATEFPLIIATADDTNIEIGGTIVATIDNGEYFQVPSTFYSGTTAGSNMYIFTSKDTYAYQCLAGSTGNQTAGLNFIAPVNCLLPNTLDNIPDIRNMAGITVTGGVTIIAAVNTPDANVQVFQNGIEITKPPSSPVAGTPDWKTFYIPNLDGNISVQSTGTLAIGFLGFDGNRGVAGYFSGFDTVPDVLLEVTSGPLGSCFVGASLVLNNEEVFDAYQWFQDGILIPDANGTSFDATEAGSYFVRITRGPCTFDSDPIDVFFCDPDIVVNKSVADAEITEGETTTFTIRVENLGFEAVTNLQITDNIPAGLTLINAQTITGNWTNPVWNIGTLEPGTPVFLELEVRGDEIALDPLVSITNTVINSQDQTDFNITTDILSASVIVHNDFDEDGVIDIVDLDDDNDGVYDTDECSEFFCFESIVNESFEEPVLSSNFQILDETAVPGWLTTATDSRIELWRSGFLGVDSYDGNQHAELNANRFGALYQNLCLTPGTVMNWSLRHRARGNGIDEMQLRIGADLASATVQETMATDNTAWVLYSGTYIVPADQNNTVFIFEAISTASGSISVGNFIDDINITIAVPATCRDTDGDGIPNNLDLDSDNDGCSDADEFYKDNNADGNDGGEFGSGIPVVDPNDGSVISASYIEVLAPEIILGNTSETTGGIDINGQDISLGDTFDYVLRFQNTGDDNATNYSIRNVLPANVTLNSIDYGGVIGITDSYDVTTNTVTFQIPDNLMEVGDPEYTIRIEVTVSGNCSDFVDACSNTLENLAFSTFQGATNTTVFSDEPSSTSLPVCNPTPQVATNSLLNDLMNCNVARTVQLCGDNVILSAGDGFSSYVWAIDTNGNGQIDASETPIDDGDPDSDPSTLLVTNVGNYIVEKTGASGCADLIELITVELFGATQTNPIISFFNQVNSDANPNNNLNGEIVVCSIDGSELPQIFLCGETDDATIQLGITDAISIEWELLDETSCDESADECANTNNSCTWNTISTGNNYTVSDAGRYRVVINYLNGCFSRFFFDVFKNTLDFTVPTPRDIVCGTPGNIRVAGVGSGFGYQLVDVATNTIIVPFLDNNGPNFDITTSGTYKVQITSLDSNGDPIIGACIFETEDIGILERSYEVNITTEPADCSGFGEITLQALNVFPNYNYRLFRADGTTLVAENVDETDNNHTFTSVIPGNYIIVTTTEDGCTDSQNIEVVEIPALDLSASVSENITCNAGLITLTPNGGEPSPDYRMAIWSINGVNQYTSPSDALTNATFQTTNDFLFLNSSDAGDYEFIVFDNNDCHSISNKVTLVDLGTVVIDEINTTHTPIICAGDSTSILTIVATGGTAPYEYSLDGTSFQSTNIFSNLDAGEYAITVRDSSGAAVSRCITSIPYTIDEPFRLTASATLVEDIACDPNGTLVSILNASGGQAPYEYSFDGGSNFDVVNERSLAAGTYQLVLRDNLGCTFNMNLTVPSPVVDPSITSAIEYNCIGEGTITVSSSNNTDFNYTYSLDGTENTPADSNVFNNLTNGTYTVTVGYSSALAPNQSTIFFEDFGAGSEIEIDEIGPFYVYEPQDGTTAPGNLGPAGILVSGEYTVTNFVTNPNPSYRNPQDHTGLTDGRFFAIDISDHLITSGATQTNNILWAREDLEVLPNQELSLNFFAYNIITDAQTDPNFVNPEVLIEILDNTGNLIHSEITLEIPKNTNDNDWHQRTVTFNPGTNTNIDIVFRTNKIDPSGNDLILDDISVTQLPEVCERTQDITVVIEANQAFEAALLNVIDPSCNGVSDGAIRFEVDNFDATAGYEYTITDGTNTFGPFAATNAIETSTSILGDGAYTIIVYRTDETTCTTSFTATLTAPSSIVPTASVTTALSCTTGATITASATGGTPIYQYQLEDTAGNVIGIFDFATNGNNSIFTNLSDGSYIVRVQDTNLCTETTSQIDVVPTEPVTFNVTETLCYLGSNTASIQVDVIDGNGGYQFRLDGGPWITPTPATATTHTFTGLASGSYDIEVRDQLGCPDTANTQTVIINPQLTIAANAPVISICDVDGLTDITITTNGGDSNYTYAVVNTGTTPATFATTNPAIGFGPGVYDVYVRDNNGTVSFCEAMTTITIVQDAAFTFTPTPTNVTCNTGNDGAINITAISGGQAPYTYSIDGGITYLTSTSFANLTAGSYDVSIQDVNNCTSTPQTVTISQPDAITAEATITQQYTCLQLGQITVGSVTPTTGGSGDYQYSINGSAWTASTTGGHTFTDLNDGAYTISVRDASVTDCFVTLAPITINTLPIPPTVEYTVDYNCDGTGNVTITPFDATYTYILDGVLQTGATGNLFNAIAVGSFDLRVTYSTDCHIDTNVIIEDGNALQATITGFENLDCNADNSGQITIDAINFGTNGFEYSINGNPFVGPFTNQQTITGLNAQDHSIVVRDVDNPIAGCTITLNQTLTQPDPIVANASITTVATCNNGATITANAIGGTPVYQYQLEITDDPDQNDPYTNIVAIVTPFQNSPIFNNIPASNAGESYIIRVQDANNCSDVIDAAIVVDAPENVTFDLAPTACYSGNNDGEIVVNVTNGNGGYQFRIDGGPWLTPTPVSDTTYTFNGLSNGTYTIEVRDQLACPIAPNTQTVVIESQLTLTADADVLSVCDVDGLIDINITANGGDGNYVYAVVNTGNTPADSDYTNTNPATGFASGTYDVFVRDNNGDIANHCQESFTITITQEDPIAFTPNLTNVDCFGATNGAINITAISGGQAPYTYSIDGGITYLTSTSFANLTAGSYDVRIRDNNNCESPIQTITINEPNVLTAEASQTQAYTCLQLGQITVGNVTATAGGSGDYQYSINGGAWTASTTGGFTFTDLDDGTYAISVRDANAINCFITLPDVIISPLPTPPTVTYTVDYNCDGTGNVTIAPFDATYTYILDGNSQTGATGNVFNNIAVGTFDLRITYSPDCHIDTNVIIENGNAFEAAITGFDNLNCNADNSGQITIDATNFGASGFEYSINGNPFVGPFTSQQTITGLNAQAHSIIVRDVNDTSGCSITLNQTLTEPTIITPTASITTALSCTNGATITASATGGTPTYTYQLENTSGTVVGTFDFATNDNNTLFTNLADGSYIIRVQDANGCLGTSSQIDIAATNPVAFNTTPTACYTGTSNGTIIVDVTDGNGGYQFRIDGGPWVTPTPATAITHTFTGLSAGNYTIEVRDQLGCPPTANTQNVVIADQLIVDVDITDLSACNDGLITVNATGGNGTLEYAIVPANTTPTTFTTINTLTITEAMATANPAGYDVYVQDNSGGTPICTFIEEDIILIPVAPLTVSGVATDPECFDGLGEIEITVTGGTAPYTYTLVDLSPADGIDYGRNNSNITTTTLNYNGVGVGNYEIIIDDSFGCSITSATVTINNAIEISADIIPILPADCTSIIESEFGFEFINIITPTGTVEYSNDGGTTWQTSPELRGTVANPTFSGTEVFPSIRVEVSPGVYCQQDFSRYIIPFPLDDLDITLSAIIVGCNDLRVTVEGSQGDSSSGYDYTYTDDPANFNTFITDPNVWVENIPLGTSHTFQNINATTPQYPEVPLLVPGRTYVFYVRDGAGCIRQSNVNVNDIPGIGLPIEITADITPSCDSAANGAITFNLNPDMSFPSMRWEIFELGNPTPIETSGGNVLFSTTVTTTVPLAEGEYFIEVIQVDGSNVDACAGASENIFVNELAPLSATATATRDISCNLPGLITISGITGGGGAPYTFDVTGPVGFTALSGSTNNPVEIPVNSPAGNYTVTLYDQFSCPLVLNTVALGLTPNPTLNVSQDNCAAPITVTATGASVAGNFRYAIVANGNPAPTTFEDNAGIFTNITPGAYDIYAIDGNGCSAVETNFIVNPVLAASTSLTKLLDCTVSPDAAINIEILDGSGSYEYTITNTVGAPEVSTPTTVPSTNFDYHTSLAGDYTITIYDTTTPSSTVCNREFVINVPDRLEPVIVIDTFSNVTCNADDDGSISVSANPDNGIGPYTFEIISGPGSTATFPITAATSTNTTAVFENLEGSSTGITYTIEITAANGCTETITQIITQPDVINLPTPSVVQFGCTTGNNNDNASITIDAAAITGGSLNYTRFVFVNTTTSTTVQDGNNTTYIETDTNGGVFEIFAYDDLGCVNPIAVNATINPFDQLTVATIAIDDNISCSNAGEDITIEVNGSITNSTTTAGLANYEFTLLPTGTPQASNIFLDLAVGTHNFEVRNINTGCLITVQHIVNDPNNIEVTATPVDVVCFGDNGSVSFTINDPINTYTGGFNWEIFDNTGASIATGSDVTPSHNLPAGEYRVDIVQTANPMCPTSEFFNITGPNAPITANTTVTPIGCLPGSDGVIEIIDTQGGWGGYQYYVDTNAIADQFDSANYTNNPRFTNLAAGTYNIWIIDQNGCPTQLANQTLDVPTPIVADLRINADNCTDFAGEIEVVGIPDTNPVSGGQGSNYTYQLILDGTNFRAPQNTTVFSGLGAGSYSVEITDQLGCALTVGTQVLYDVVAPVAAIVKPIDCNSPGEITVTQTGGSGNFTYQVRFPGTLLTDTPDDTNTNGVFTNLATVGTYTFTVIDNDNTGFCTSTVSQNLESAVLPNILIDNFTNVTCNGDDDGTISVSANPDNGIGPYTFEIISGPGSTATFPIAAATSTNTTAVFENLEGSSTGITYTIEITATNGCTETITQNITQPNVITVPATAITVVDFACTTANSMNNASISINETLITGGSGTYITYEFIEEDDPNTVAVEAPNTVQTGSNTNYIETDPAGGVYTINIYDQNGCIGSTTATILPFDELLPATITVDNTITCNLGENITINAFGSITDSSTPAGLANYEFRQLPAGVFAASNTFINLAVGTHNFEVKNVNTNCIVSIQHQVLEPNTIEVAATTTDVVCAGDNGSVSFTINDPINTYTGGFSWQIYNSQGTADVSDDIIIAGATGSSTGVGPTTVFAIGAGEYRVEITQDSNPDCTASELFTIAGPNGTITALPVVTNISCVPGDDGVIEITNTQGGWGGYLYYVSTTPIANEFNASLYVSNPRFDNLIVGDYNIWIIDQRGCPIQLSNIMLNTPTPIVADLQTNIANCTDFTGEIEVVGIPATNPVSGGQGSNYTYQLLLNGSNFGTPQANTVFSNLGSGSYTVQIEDQLGCTLLVGPQVLDDVIAPTATIIKTIDCNGPGEITITQTGGSGNFDYEVRYPGTLTTDPADDTNTTGIFTGLALVGDYVFSITDTSNNCNTNITQGLEDSVIPNININAFTNVTCNGNDDGTISLSINPDNGIGPYAFEIISGAGSSIASPITPTNNTDVTAVFTGLRGTLAGIDYTVRVTAANGCSTDVTVTITQPDSITFTRNVDQFSCTTNNDTNNALITIDLSSIAGGSGTYNRFRFEDLTTGSIQESSSNIYSFFNIDGGDVEVTVFDNNGCPSAIDTITIAPFDELQSATVTLVGPSISCITPTEDIIIEVTGNLTNTSTVSGLANYEFRLLPSTTYQDANNAFIDLPFGTYTFGVRNKTTGCEIITEPYIIENPNTFDVQITNITNVICYGDNGSVELNLIDPSYTGTFSYEVFDTMGTSNRIDDVSILGPVSSIQLGATGPISIPAGEYEIVVTQEANPTCPQSRTVTINGPTAPLSVVADVTAEIGCMNDQGAILVTPSGGIAPYNITIDNGSGAIGSPIGVNSHLFEGLAAGTYTISITDASGCSVPNTPFPNVTLITPDPIAGTLDIVGLDCPGDTDGSVTFILQTAPARNITPNYSYVLNTYDDAAGTTLLRTSTSQTNPIFNNLGAGFYSITVMDDIASCPLTVTPIEQIVEPNEAQAFLVINSPVNCAGEADLLLEASGGTAPYEWSEDGVNFSPMNNLGGTNTHLFVGLSTNNYSYFIREISNPTCAAIISNTVTTTAPEALVLSTADSAVTEVSCNGESTGLIIVEANGGFGDYQYEISINNTFTVALESNSDGIFTDLSPGTYYLRVLSRDCVSNIEEIRITEPTPLVIDPVISEISCHDSTDGAITLNTTGGSGDYIYAISPNLAQFVDENVFDELAAGDYTVIIQDSNNCMELVEFTLITPEELVATATPTDEICYESEDGTVTLEIEGGTAPYFTALNSNNDADFTQDMLQYTDLPNGTHVLFVRDANDCEVQLVFDINSGANLNAEVLDVYACSSVIATNSVGLSFEDQTIIDDLLFGLDTSDPSEMGLDATFENLTPGDHFITVLHSGGCIRTFDFTIEDFEPLELQLIESDINTISAAVTGGREEFTFTTDNENIIDNGNGEFIITATDTYTITVTDENGCNLSQSIFVEFIDIEIPTFFTPDGDGQNDLWLPRNIEPYPNIFIKIYDRYGRQVYRFEDNRDGWDGLYFNSDLPTGDYWYLIKLNGENDQREFIGNFTLYR